MRRRARLVVCVLVAACGGLGPQDAQRAELQANQARWRSLGPD